VFLAVRQTWSEDRVFFLDENGQQFSLPVGWTDAAARCGDLPSIAAVIESHSCDFAMIWACRRSDHQHLAA
jgi:Family of unknown function (DUF5372)